MHTISKRAGTEEEFRKDKIERSMRGAGISDETARIVAAEIKHHDGITTAEVRGRVIGAIKNREPQAANQYESHSRKAYKA